MGVADDYFALPANKRVEVLAWAIHQETINARSVHHYTPQDCDGLYKITERIHRLAQGVIQAQKDDGDRGRWALELVLEAQSISIDRLKSWIHGEWPNG